MMIPMIRLPVVLHFSDLPEWFYFVLAAVLLYAVISNFSHRR